MSMVWGVIAAISLAMLLINADKAKNIIETWTAPQSEAKTPEQITGNLVETVKQPILVPIWLFIMIILMVLILK